MFEAISVHNCKSGSCLQSAFKNSAVMSFRQSKIIQYYKLDTTHNLYINSLNILNLVLLQYLLNTLMLIT